MKCTRKDCKKDALIAIHEDYVHLCEACYFDRIIHEMDETRFFVADISDHVDDDDWWYKHHKYIPSICPGYEYCPACGDARKVAA